MTSGIDAHLNGVWGRSDSEVYAVGDEGQICMYRGDAWECDAMSDGSTLRSIAGFDNGNLMAVGWNADEDAVTWYGEADEGTDAYVWSIVDPDTGVTSPFRDIWSFGIGAFHVGASERITTSLGLLFGEYEDPLVDFFPGNLNSVWGRSTTDVYVVGDYGTIAHFEDGLWPMVDRDALSAAYGREIDDFHFRGVFGNDTETVVVGKYGAILRGSGLSFAFDTQSPTPWIHRSWLGPDGLYGIDYDKLYRFDGTLWLPIEIETGVVTSFYLDIWGAAPDDLWISAVGGFLHYDGDSWQFMAEELDGDDGIYFFNIWGAAADDIYANDDYNLYHYDGEEWSAIDVGSSDTTSYSRIWGTGPDDVYVLASDGGEYPVYHFDGETWSPLNTGASSALRTIDGTSLTDVFAASDQIHHFNGSVWTPMAWSPGTGGIYDIHARAADDVFFVGRNSIDPVLVHYNGSTWKSEAVTALGQAYTDARLRRVWTTETDVYVMLYENDEEWKSVGVLRHCNEWSHRE